MSSAMALPKVLFSIIILAAVGQMTQTMYIPSVPLMAEGFAVSAANLQAVMACYLIPYGLSQFFYGPLSDRVGRKPVIIAGLVIYVLGTCMALMADSFAVFLAASVIQGLGIGCGGAMARTIPRDCFSGNRLHRANSLASMGLIFSPLLAPVLGGTLSTYLPWQASYVFLLILALSVTGFIVFSFQETLPKESRQISPVLKSYTYVFSHRQFVGHLICLVATFSGVAVFEAAAGVLLGGTLALDAATVSMLFVMPLPGYLLGSWLSTPLATRVSNPFTLRLGVVATILGALVITVPGLEGMVTVSSLIGGAFIYFLGAGILFPSASTAAIKPFPFHAGTAGALMGGMQNLVAGGCTLLASLASTDSQLHLGMILMLMSFISATSLLLTRNNESESNLEIIT
ncbi:multidrug efflux MFS transporter EmrD [Veronia pacifica]|uniref:MFS transporter n=1 Tax=Veronia pacifica TaxID=1080227 RepID=A0A1C3EF34_9GAMM|nr:multidrug efflux MFS transporter EmrD [Veronia pacifica]ODA31833.1 MFS transporter [Veronia pacifica]